LKENSRRDEDGREEGKKRAGSFYAEAAAVRTFKRRNPVNITIPIRHRTQSHSSSLQKLQQVQGARKEELVHVMPVYIYVIK